MTIKCDLKLINFLLIKLKSCLIGYELKFL